jgi:hypothetical protein
LKTFILFSKRKRIREKLGKCFMWTCTVHSFKFYSIKCNLKLFQIHIQSQPIFSCNVTINFCTCKKNNFFSEIEILTADGGHVHMKLKCESINFKMGSKHWTRSCNRKLMVRLYFWRHSRSEIHNYRYFYVHDYSLIFIDSSCKLICRKVINVI